ncbi:hypothetical protein QBC33DRAFT_357500 [Phialemonium atrogriseum]|uniref:Aminoglycoside phosphotransferase domain-containing protein n=1 Tax=Phialemonium atrogriseum TaxID=1093897 RepID=A0AAJ0C2I6_9PEZI|nr:uncharacterized protein QBC33DRAFT_357500 [Phialemonium atrogriseum]KAK1768721.1 hypothetical protein QBC33DRAFT_357500 [Phialemonium atrogriseum]
MEYVSGKTFRELMADWRSFREVSEYCYTMVEKAIRLFLSFYVSEGAAPGPYGGGIIRHPLFNDYKAPIQYDSVDMLEKHLNKVATIIRKATPTVRLEPDLHFVFADLYEGNFMFTDAGDIYVIDFEQASFLPLCFMSYALIQRHQVCGPLEERLNLPQNNIPTMRRICGMFVMSTSRLGKCLSA